MDVRPSYETLRQKIQEMHQKALTSTGQTAIMFSDLASSTIYKAQRDQVASLLKTYRHNAEVEEQVQKLNGSVIKSLGDGILATFKIEEPDDISFPINAAIRIQKHFARLNQDLVADERILTRIGITCGHVVDFGVLNPEGRPVLDPQGVMGHDLSPLHSHDILRCVRHIPV